MKRELAPPFADPPEHTSRHGTAFWVGLAIGGACMTFGLISLLSRTAATEPAAVAVYVVGLALLHDMVLVPVTIAVAWGLRTVTPRRVRGVVLGAAAVSAIVVGFSVPLVARWGAQPDNPSLLPRAYGAGLAIVVAAIWASAAVVAVARRRWGAR